MKRHEPGPDRTWNLSLRCRRDTRLLGSLIAQHVGPGWIVFLDGQLGAGKTFLTRSILRALGLPPHIPVTSPTFSLMNEYEVKFPVVHVDLYRMPESSDISDLDLAEHRETSLLVIEWGRDMYAETIGPWLQITLSRSAEGRDVRIACSEGEGWKAAGAVICAFAEHQHKLRPRVTRQP